MDLFHTQLDDIISCLEPHFPMAFWFVCTGYCCFEVAPRAHGGRSVPQTPTPTSTLGLI